MIFVPGTSDTKYNRGEKYIVLAFSHGVFQVSVAFFVILSVPQPSNGKMNIYHCHVKRFYENAVIGFEIIRLL